MGNSEPAPTANEIHSAFSQPVELHTRKSTETSIQKDTTLLSPMAWPNITIWQSQQCIWTRLTHPWRARRPNWSPLDDTESRTSPNTARFGCMSTSGNCSSNMRCPAGGTQLASLLSCSFPKVNNNTWLLKAWTFACAWPSWGFLSVPRIVHSASEGRKTTPHLCMNSTSVRSGPQLPLNS